MTMAKWLLAALLVLQAHFAASYIIPRDREAQRTFGGLLRWAWPWAIGDGGLLGRITTSGFSSGWILPRRDHSRGVYPCSPGSGRVVDSAWLVEGTSRRRS